MTLQELKNKLKDIQNSLETALTEGNFENVTKFTNEADVTIKNIEILTNAQEIQNKINGATVNPMKPIIVNPTITSQNKTEEFFNIVKTSKTNPREFANVMAANGNEMIMPEDLVKEIREKRIADGSLEDLISWENPTAKSGSRTLELEGDDDGLIDLDENLDVEIGEIVGPKFKNIKFDKKTLAALIKVSNSLLEDSVLTLKKFIVKTLATKGKKSLRKKILEIADTFENVEATTIDDIKKVIEVNLDPAYLEGATVVIGQELYNHISSLKDSDGKYIIQPDVTQSGVKLLFGVPVRVVTKKVLAGGKMYIGNFREAILGFGDEDMKLAISDQAGFTKNQTIFRAIERFNIVKGFDDALYTVTFTLPLAASTLSRKR